MWSLNQAGQSARCPCEGICGRGQCTRHRGGRPKPAEGPGSKSKFPEEERCLSKAVRTHGLPARPADWGRASHVTDHTGCGESLVVPIPTSDSGPGAVCSQGVRPVQTAPGSAGTTGSSEGSLAGHACDPHALLPVTATLWKRRLTLARPDDHMVSARLQRRSEQTRPQAANPKQGRGNTTPQRGARGESVMSPQHVPGE